MVKVPKEKANGSQLVIRIMKYKLGESELYLGGNKRPPKAVEDGSGMPDCFRNSILCPEPSVCGSETVRPRSNRPFSRLAIQ